MEKHTLIHVFILLERILVRQLIVRKVRIVCLIEVSR